MIAAGGHIGDGDPSGRTYLKVSIGMSTGGGEAGCGLDAALAVMGGKWKPIILYHVRDGSRRFGELKRRVTGISEKVLIQQLRELVAAGVLVRHDHREVPPRVDYTITAFGETLVQALLPLCDWGTQNRKRVEKLMGEVDHRPV